jgi:uncharacterized protein with PQ loop repeat
MQESEFIIAYSTVQRVINSLRTQNTSYFTKYLVTMFFTSVILWIIYYAGAKY